MYGIRRCAKFVVAGELIDIDIWMIILERLILGRQYSDFEH